MNNLVQQFEVSGFDTAVLQADRPVLVDFYADWCQPCRMVAPTVAELAGEYDEQAIFGKVDVDANPELARRYSVTSIPTLLLFRGGEVVERFVGVRPKAELAAAIDRVLGHVTN